MLSLLTLLSVADAQPPITHKCATLEQLRLAPQLIANADVPVRPPNSGKTERDSVCSNCNTLSSDNFIVRWGSGVSQSQAQSVLDSFEYSWDVEVNQLGYDQPSSTETYLFNIYIGDSGGNSPGGYGAAGYFTGDNQGYPMIVLAKQTLTDEYYLDSTIAHEFFHALQGRTGRYDYDEYGAGAWYWEATANWVETEVYANEAGMAFFLVGYTFFPHYPVNFFDYPDQGTLQEYHQYGAFIFPLHLTEVEADSNLIRSSWQDNSSESDPMEVLSSYLQPFGTNIEEAWLHHIARMTVMDYQMGDTYEEYLSYYNQYPESQDRYAATVTQNGTSGWKQGPSDTKPQRFGHNTIIARNLSDSAMTFAIRGENTGSAGSSAIYGGTVTRLRGGNTTYFPLTFSGVDGEVTITGIQSGDEHYLTVGVWTDEWNPNRVYSETFDYEYNILSADGVVSEPSGEPSNEPSNEPGSQNNGEGGDLVPGLNDDDDLKAACSTTSATDFAWIGVLGLIGLARRRS